MQEKTFLGQSPLGFHRVAYTEWGEGSARPPVICAHGLTRNGRDFDYLARELQRDTKVFCPDIVGRGKSDWLSNSTYYNYAQYLSDMTALIARTGAGRVNWVGTSMGGIIGMMLAAADNSPIDRLVVNDVGPFIPLAALKRIGAYISEPPVFATLDELEQHLRKIYASFGRLEDDDWKHLAKYAARAMPDGKLALAYDPGIAQSFATLDRDVDFWAAYDRIRCPVLVLHGMNSDILPSKVAQEMTRRGPRAELVEIPHVGHAPALMDWTQLALIIEFLSL